MNRLCIYVTYNRENKIEAYMGYILKALREHIADIYAVCNYPQILDGAEYIEPYIDGIFYRENIGYDSGAYKDMLCSILGWDKVYQYDELILLNDSFFGPFYDMKRFFDLMEDVTCDFWGMTRHFSGILDSRYPFKPHVQSYFLVFRSKVLFSEQFRNFWDNFAYPKTYVEAILEFEIKISEYLDNEGFASKALTDVWGIEFGENVDPCLFNSLELIRDRGLPILKKKCVKIRNSQFADAIKSVEFLESNHLYPTGWIWDAIDSQFNIENYALENTNSLELFYNRYSKVYIYGAGLCGKNLVLYFEKKGWKLNGILVSDKVGQDIECTAFEEAEIDDETGIIVSVLRRDTSEEIVKYIETKSKCKREQLFVIYECKAIRQ